MTARRVHFDRGSTQVGDGEFAAWETWFDRHGVRWTEIPVGSVLVCDDDEFRISYLVPDPDDQGRFFDPVTKEFRTRVEVIQLEAPALEMPRLPFETEVSP